MPNFLNRHNLFNQTCACVLIILHLITFGPIKEALAFSAQSTNYRMNSAGISLGGQQRVSTTAKLWQDSIGEPYVGKAQSTNYALNAGFIPMIQANPPVQTQTILNFNWNENESRTEAFDLDDYFSSPDGYALSYSVTGNSNITVTIDPTSHKVSFSQPQAWNGTEKVTFTATDSEGNSVTSNQVSLQVAAVNNPPVLDYIPDITANEGDLVKITPHATDLDLDPITYTFSSPLDANGQWQTDYNSAGTYTVTVTATDPTNLTDSKQVHITVKNVNRPPVLSPIAPITVNEGDLVTIKPQASDADNDPITFYYTNVDTSKPCPIDSTGKWLTGYTDAGVYNIRVNAFDGMATVSQDVKITVNNVNRPPDATLTLDSYTVNLNDHISIYATGSDPDGDALTYSLKKDSTVISSGVFTGPYTGQVSFSTSGDHKLSFSLTDAGGLTTTKEVNIDVVNPNANRDIINPVMGDFNGDALLDLGLYDSSTGTWEICLSAKGVFNAAQDWITNFGTSTDWWPIGGDFNGDGTTDIGVYNNTTGELKIALSSGSSFSVSGTWLNFPDASYSWQIFTGNFNGDKYTDVGFYNKDTGEIRVALGNGSGFGAVTTWATGFDTGCAAIGGDFNGDSLTDLCLFNKSAGSFSVAMSNSRAFVDKTNWLSGFATNNDVLVSDFNNDGRADVGYWDKDTHNIYYALSTADGSNEKFVDKGLWRNFGTSSDVSVTTGDFDGNGVTDLSGFNRDNIGINHWHVELSTDKPSDLLSVMDNGIGGQTQITYTYAAQSDNPGLPFPVYVASSVSLVNTFPADRAATYTQNSTFSGGYYDAVEREFRGFSKVRVSDPITNNYTETYFYQGKPGQDGALKGQIDKMIAYDGNGRQISQTQNTYQVRTAGPQDRFLGFPALTEQTTTVWEENGSSLTTQTDSDYDAIGNPILARSEGDTSVIGDEKSTETTYAQAYTVGFNRPLQTVLKNKDGNIVTQKNLEYDDKGNLTKETVPIINPITQANVNTVTQYTYDSFGNLTSTTNALGRSVTTNYETDFYTYPAKITNSLGQSVSYIYEPKFGAVKSTTDANGQTSSTTYDSLGRTLTVTNAYNQVVTTFAYPDFNTKITTNALNLSKTEYIDGLGRKYKSISVGEDGANARNVSSEIYYNARGLTDKESLVHYVDEDPTQIAYSRYEYDIRGRVNKTIADFPGVSADAEVSVNYISPFYAEATDAQGHRKGTKKDVYGKVIEVTEFTSGGVFKTQYEYDVQGDLTKTTDNQGNVTQIFYDSAGRKLKMIDPDMGTWTYEYDIVGNLKKQTDAKAQVLTFDYDELNRLINKQGLSSQGSVPMVLASYAYDDATKDNCIGRLSKVTDQSGSTEFFYDKLGREVRSIKTIDATPYTVERTYDVLDRLVTLKYPDGQIVNYSYDSNSGLLEQVYTVGFPHSTISYVSDISYNAKGQIRNIQYGNGTHTDYTYGQDLRLSRIFTQGTSQSLQDLNYIFDHNGNLTTLTDNLRSNIRTYNYDDLDRLTEAHNVPNPAGGNTNFYYQYDPIGNMTYKSDLGIMSYGQGAGPHAVTSAGGYIYAYDANGNMISGRNKAMGYDVENRLLKVTEGSIISSFAYDGDGGRVEKTNGSDSTIYIGSLFEKDSSGKTTNHIFAGANRVASVESTGNTYYYHSDHLGSSNVITDRNGQQVQYCEYTPYGTLARNEGTDAVKYKFTGKELDTTGLYFYGARYYDPVIGRFISADTIVQAPYDPQSLNRYAYCHNNPINYVDPTGHFWWFIAALIISAVIGAVANVAIAGASGQLTSWTAFWSTFAAGATAGSVAYLGSFVPGAGTILGGMLIGAVAGGAAGAVGSSAAGGFTWGAVGMGAVFGGAIGGFGNSSVGRSFGKAVGNAINKGIGKLPFGQYIQRAGQFAGGKLSELYERAGNDVASMRRSLSVNKADPIELGRIDVVIKKGYPPNQGFLGESTPTTLEPGTVVDRYGEPNGRFVAPQGTPPTARSLPPGTEITSLYSYEVIKPFGVNAGTTAPWFNQPGLGTQYELPYSTQQLVDDGYLRRIDN